MRAKTTTGMDSSFPLSGDGIATLRPLFQGLFMRESHALYFGREMGAHAYALPLFEGPTSRLVLAGEPDTMRREQ